MNTLAFILAVKKLGYFGALLPSDFSYLFWSLGQNGPMWLAQPKPGHSAFDLGAGAVNLQLYLNHTCTQSRTCIYLSGGDSHNMTFIQVLSTIF